MDFAQAFTCLKFGAVVMRDSWNRQLLVIEPPHEGDPSHIPLVLYINDMEKNMSCPYSPTHADVMAEDWIIASKDWVSTF